MRFVPDEPSVPAFWQVCFVGPERKAPWDWFLPDGYRHVFALGYLADRDCWLCYDVSCFKTEITVLSNARAGWLLGWADDQGGVLSWPAPVARQSFALRLGLWCVPSIKHLLGLRCVVLTPKGLHDYLVRKGAKPLIEKTREPIRRQSQISANHHAGPDTPGCGA